MHPHDLYKPGDLGIPDNIRDRNGDITLGLCKRCGRAEIDLDKPCLTMDELEPIGLAIDDLLNLTCAMSLSMVPNETHVTALRAKLPEVIKKIHDAYVALGGDPLDLD